MANSLIINNIPIKKGEHAEIIFNIAKLPTHTVIALPVYVYRGIEDGPVLLLTSAIHGNEVNNVELIREMIENKDINPSKGTVIVIPIVNIYGFIQQMRELPDGKDLNRNFPGSKDGSLGSIIAYTLVNEILPHVDYGIDFHTGAINRSNYPQIRCNFSDESNKSLAEAFAPPFIINSKPHEKSLRGDACKRGKVFITYEGGEASKLDPFAIQEGINGTKRIMRYLKMVSNTVKANKIISINQTRWIRASHAGLYRSFIKLGDPVKKKQVLACITDPFGDFSHKLKASSDGYVIGLNNTAVVHKGDALIHLGIEE
ncbi:MAG: succinylglutamate desuccinylase/aspartoacylase family protein [Spirochaetota bacterium]|nr:succinylglutamate desuccinylase/aspartoacylase family protein [Spirochaetota bacterium]